MLARKRKGSEEKRLYVPQLIEQFKRSKPNLPDWEEFLKSPEYVRQWGEALNVTPQVLQNKYREFLEKHIPDPTEWNLDLTSSLENELNNYWSTYAGTEAMPTMVQRLVKEIATVYVDRYYFGKPLEEELEYDLLSEFLRNLEMNSTYAFPEDFLSKFVYEIRKLTEEECTTYLDYFVEDLGEAAANAEGYAEEIAEDMMATYEEEFSEAEQEIDEYGPMY